MTTLPQLVRRLSFHTHGIKRGRPVALDEYGPMRHGQWIRGQLVVKVDDEPMPPALLEDVTFFWATAIPSLWRTAIDLAPGQFVDSGGGARAEFWYSQPRRLRVRLSLASQSDIFDVAAEPTLKQWIDEMRRVLRATSASLGAEASARSLETLDILQRRMERCWATAPEGAWTIGPDVFVPSPELRLPPPTAARAILRALLRGAPVGGELDEDALNHAASWIRGLAPGLQLGALEQLHASAVSRRLGPLWLLLIRAGMDHFMVARRLVQLAGATCNADELAAALAAGTIAAAALETSDEYLSSMLDLGPSPVTIAASVRALDHPRLASVATLNLAHFGVTTAHPALNELLEAGEPTVRRAARKVLGGIA